MGAIVGPPGVGKTTTCREYIRHHGSPSSRAHLVTMSPVETKPFHSLRAVGEEVGEVDLRSSFHIFEQLKYRLSGGPHLLIIDEAQHLEPKSLDVLRSVHDATGCGIVFTGNERITMQFKGKRGLFAQFTSRLGLAIQLDPSTEEDVTAFLDHHRITGEMARAALIKLGTKEGNLRDVGKVIAIARARAREAPIALPDIQFALRVKQID